MLKAMEDKEIIRDFVNESKQIVTECLNLLEGIEGNYQQVSLLETYGNSIDRIMGGARTLGLDLSEESVLSMISDYAAVCKNVGYKAAQIKGNEAFFNVCVGLLIDGSEMLSRLLDKAELPLADVKKTIPDEFIGRVRWALQQFSDDVRSTVASTPSLSQAEVNALLNKLAKKA